MHGVNTKHKAGAKSEDMWMGLGMLNVAKENNRTNKANLALTKRRKSYPTKKYNHTPL